MGVEFADQGYNTDLIDFELPDFVLNKSINTKTVYVLFLVKTVSLSNPCKVLASLKLGWV